jgi:predicted GIY-YIG superfamily endonuclease
MPYCYLLRCSDGSYYAGSTWDLTKRREALIAGRFDDVPALSKKSNFSRPES